MNIFILILNWNNAKDTLECLESIEKVDYPHYEVVVIDNGSTDGSLSEIRTKFPHYHFVENEDNLGYAEGNNRGISYALDRGADAVLLLNNDTVVDPQFLHAFAAAARDNPKAGVFGAKLYFYDEPTTIHYAGGTLHPTTGRCMHLESAEERVQKTDYACGCALLATREAIAKVGMMDPRFFLIWEEIDWCWRIRDHFDCLYVPGAKVWHKVSASFGENPRGYTWQYYYHRNRLLFYQKHQLLSRYKGRLFKELFLLLKNPRDERHRAALKGMRDFCLRKFGKSPC